mgnify:CR=1 FL=1
MRWTLVVLIALGCGSEDEPTRSEKWAATVEQAQEHGAYCCMTNGQPDEPECSSAKAGAVYVEDFNDVDASGRGKACGWVLD